MGYSNEKIFFQSFFILITVMQPVYAKTANIRLEIQRFSSSLNHIYKTWLERRQNTLVLRCDAP